jgi:kumamolisin
VPDALQTSRVALVALIVAGGIAVLATIPVIAWAGTSPDRGERRARSTSDRETVVIGLRREQGQLGAFVQGRSTPGEAGYRDYAPVAVLAQRYGATESTWRRVRRYLRRKGIRNAKLDVTRGFATVRVTQRQRRRAFPTPRRLRKLIWPVLFTDSSHELGKRAASVSPHAAARSTAPQRTGTPAGCANGVASGGLTPNQYRTAYGVDPLHARGLFGQGTRIAFVEFGGFSQRSLNQFARCFGFAPPHPTTQTVGLREEPGPDTEVQLDVQIAAALAPQARMDIFEAATTPGDLVRLFAAPLDTDRTGGEAPHVISSSLGFCERDLGKPVIKLLDYVLAMTAGAGITVANASGDNGSSTCPARQLTVAYPGSSGFVTSVGGTNVALSDGNEIDSEVVWNDSQGAGGGGRSQYVHRPAYQGNRAAFSFRAMPDVAFNASGTPGYAIRTGGEWMPVNGTSAAAPLLAGGALLTVQAAARAGVERPGLLNPLLYQAARADSPGLFHDIVKGNNDLYRVGCCSARPGYDRASGWGSVQLDRLADRVVATGR